MKKIIFALIFLRSVLSFAQTNDNVKVLVIDAHPDDESAYSATIYKITHELNGIVDLAIITNGEAGYKYSLLSEPYYHLKLTDEKTGRENLPSIRKKEMLNAAGILGIRNCYFLDQTDNHYTLDADSVLEFVWNTSLVKTRLRELIDVNKYDFIFCLLPDSATHGHHKAATILALQVHQEMFDKKRPIILAGSTSTKSDTSSREFTMLKYFPITSVKKMEKLFRVDRTTSFGYNKKLNYKIIVNWAIAEHKSQGTLHNLYNSGDYENFWYFDVNDKDRLPECEKLFERLSKSRPE